MRERDTLGDSLRVVSFREWLKVKMKVWLCPLCETFGDAENVIPDTPKMREKVVKLKGSVPVAIVGISLS